MTIETVILEHAIYCRGRGRKTHFTTKAGSTVGEVVEGIELEDGYIRINRGGAVVLVPLNRALELYPKKRGRPFGKGKASGPEFEE